MRDLAPCQICGSRERAVLYESTLSSDAVYGPELDPYGGHYAINRCARCGLIYSSPIFDEGEVKSLYENSAHTNVTAGEEANVRTTMRGYYELARPHLAGRERLLDIGCDMGFFLQIAREDGFKELYGTEPNPTARRIAEQLPASRISENFYEQQDYPADHFDLISLIHVIDHLVYPNDVLARARGHLKHGGVLIAVVHNVELILARLMGEKFPPFNFYHHYFFSKRTLAELVAHNGFQPIAVLSTPNCYSLRFFAEHAPGVPAAAKRAMRRLLEASGLAEKALSINVGNIGIVARRGPDRNA